MSDLQIIVLAIVQGITEFLPISSSGHLILVPLVTGWPDQGLAMDVAVHVGTLGAVMLYLWRDLWRMLVSLIQFRSTDPELVQARKMILFLIIGTIPVVIAGLAFKDFFSEALRSMAVIGWAMLGFGILLYIIDRACPDGRTLDEMQIKGALIVGLWQVLALIPGTSRAGITMTGARWMGFSRVEAARFSMLLSIPTILAAGMLLTLDMLEQGGQFGTDAMLAAGLALISALIAMALMMRWLKTASFTPFVIYRVVLGVILILVSAGQ